MFHIPTKEYLKKLNVSPRSAPTRAVFVSLVDVVSHEMALYLCITQYPSMLLENDLHSLCYNRRMTGELGNNATA